jgi:hypothetical protein
MDRAEIEKLADLPPIVRILLGVTLVVLGAVLLVNHVPEAVPSVRAATGSGEIGTFELERKVCVKGHCGWAGSYVSAEGDVHLRDVEFYGDLPETSATGSRVTALDTGSSGRVYSPAGSWGWVASVAWALLVGLALAAAGVHLVRLKRRSPEPAPGTTYGAAPSAPTQATATGGR